MMEEAPQDTLVLYNKQSKASKEVILDFGFCDDPGNLLIRIGGDEYKLVSTKTQEEIRLEKQITTFGTQEFPKVAQRFPKFGTSSENMIFTDEIRHALQERLDRPGYKMIRRAILKDQAIFTRICHAFAHYVAATRTVDALLQEAKQRRLDEVYMIDYLKRYLLIMNELADREHPPLRKTISDQFAVINKDIDIDDRRPIGSSKILELLGPFMSALQQYKDQMNQVPMESKFYEVDNQTEDLNDMWEAIHKASRTAKTDLENYQIYCEQRTQTFSEMKEDKLIYHTKRIFDLHNGLLEKYNTAQTHITGAPDEMQEAQETFVKYLKKYVSDVAEWGETFVCDRRPLSAFFTKMLELQYDTVFYYVERRSKDEQWILHLIQAIQAHHPYLEKAIRGELREPSTEG